MGSPTNVVLGSVAGAIAGILAATFVPRIFPTHREAAPRSQSESVSPQEWERQQIELFRADPVNPKWAGPAAEAVVESVKEASTNGAFAKLDGVECHAHSCLVKLKWKNRQEAAGEFGRFLALSLRSLSGCTSSIYLPLKDASPYEAQLIITGCA